MSTYSNTNEHIRTHRMTFDTIIMGGKLKPLKSIGI